MTRVDQYQGTVLLAEDMPDTQKMLRGVLSRYGLTVVLANNGIEALENAANTNFEMIFMDTQMPLLDGLEATRQLRRGGYYGPIVAMTAAQEAGPIEECRLAGCDEFLGKPFKRSELEKILALYMPKASQLHKTEDNAEFQKAKAEFMVHFPRRLQELERALLNSDFTALARMSHKLAGAAAFAYRDVYQHLIDLENACHNDTSSCKLILSEVSNIYFGEAGSKTVKRE